MELGSILKKKLASFDYLMLILVVGLSIFGIIVVGSATRIHLGASIEEYEKQKLWVITGLFLFSLAAFIDYKFITKFYIVAYVINFAFLIAVLLFGTEMESGNVTRSIEVVSGITIQPSEFAKIFMLVYMSKLVDRLGDKLNNIFILLLIGLSIIAPVYLIMRQPSLSASMVVLTVSLAILFVGGVSFKYIFAAAAVIVPGAFIFIQDIFREEHKFVDLFLEEYQIQDRIIPFLRPDLADKSDLYQMEQSMRAIGSGQLTGKGLYQGTLNSLNYVPQSHNDFIFAVIGEEFGYVGCICVLAILFVIIAKCLYAAVRAQTITGKLICSGVGFMFAFQTFVNVGVSIGMLPNTGMVLPFISYGGSSMWVNMVAAGLVINVGMSLPEKKGFTLFEE